MFFYVEGPGCDLVELHTACVDSSCLCAAELFHGVCFLRWTGCDFLVDLHAAGCNCAGFGGAEFFHRRFFYVGILSE